MSDERWQPARFRDTDVWVRLDAAGQPARDPRGLVAFRYQPQGKDYHTHADRLELIAGAAPVMASAARPEASSRPSAPRATPVRTPPATPGAVPPGAIEVWTDGACSGNPGPAGLGVHIRDGSRIDELSEFLGDATNNIAELMAILRGLEMVEGRDAPVVVMSDSEYGLGLLTKNWKPKKNQELVATLRQVVARFSRLSFVKVAGHAGIPGNERADLLARRAIETRTTTRTAHNT